jgi:curli biogenesis system outer membrane secretion channel CsgG
LPVKRTLYTSISLFVVAAALLPTATKADEIKAFVLHPPEKIFEGIETVAVLDFKDKTGRYSNKGEALADYIITALLNENRGMHKEDNLFGADVRAVTFQAGARTDVYSIIERSRLSQIMQEQGLSTGDLFDDSKAVELGNLLGAQALVTGSLNYTFEDKSYKENTLWSKKPQPCIERKAKTTVRFRILDIETSQILGSSTAKGGAKSKKCGDDRSDIKPLEELFERSLQEAGIGVANYFSPRFTWETFDLRGEGSKSFQILYDQAGAAAKDLDIDRAYQYYLQAYKKDEFFTKTLYNLGVLNEIAGNYERALNYYDEALMLRGKKGDAKTEKAAARAERGLAALAYFKMMGIDISPHVFPDPSSDPRAETYVLLAGEEGTRCEVFKAPDLGSEVVWELPIGARLKVVEETDEWFKVDVGRRGTGYVHGSKARLDQ